MKYGHSAKRPREMPPAEPPKPTTSWWINLSREEFAAACRARYVEMSESPYGRMRLTTDEAGKWR